MIVCWAPEVHEAHVGTDIRREEGKKVLKRASHVPHWFCLKLCKQNSEGEIAGASETQQKKKQQQQAACTSVFYVTKMCEYSMDHVEASEAYCVMGTAPTRNCWAESQESEMREREEVSHRMHHSSQEISGSGGSAPENYKMCNKQHVDNCHSDFHLFHPFESSTMLRFRGKVKISERKIEGQWKCIKQTLLPFPMAENKPPGNIQVREKRYFNLNMKFIFCSRLDFKYERNRKPVGFIFKE